ncbi:MAG: hypothetical protein ACKVOH_01070 [Chlamydiales bacterium]
MPIGDADSAKIAQAFQTRGERVVFDKSTGQFSTVATKEAKRLAGDSTYVTNLSGLKDEFAKVGLTASQRTQIHAAIQRRAADVESRLGFFATLFGAKAALMSAYGALRELAGSVTLVALGALGMQAALPEARVSVAARQDAARQSSAPPAPSVVSPPAMMVGMPPPPPPPPPPGPQKTPFGKALDDLGSSLGEEQEAAILKRGCGSADAGKHYGTPTTKAQLQPFITSLEGVVSVQEASCKKAVESFSEASEGVSAAATSIRTVALQYNLRVRADQAQQRQENLSVPCLAGKEGISVVTTFYPDARPIEAGIVGDDEEVVGPISTLITGLQERMLEDLTAAHDQTVRAKKQVEEATAACKAFGRTPEGAALSQRLQELDTAVTQAQAQIVTLGRSIKKGERNDTARELALKNIETCKQLLKNIESDMKAYRALVSKKQTALRAAKSLAGEGLPRKIAAPTARPTAPTTMRGLDKLGMVAGGVRKKPTEFVLRSATELKEGL